MIGILKETDRLIVCVKPVGAVSQGEGPKAMPQLLAAQLGCAVYPVHRLDQAVGGVIVYAKTAQEAARLTQQMGQGGGHRPSRRTGTDGAPIRNPARPPA